jgi:hypothetical protein
MPTTAAATTVAPAIRAAIGQARHNAAIGPKALAQAGRMTGRSGGSGFQAAASSREGEAELGEDLGDVVLDGVAGNAELLGDLGVASPLTQ